MSKEVLRYAGFGPETVFGTAVPAVWHTDVASASLDAPANPELIFEGGLGRSPLVKRPGPYSPSGDIALPVDIRTIGWLLRWALGGYRFTAGTLPAKHRHEIWGSQNVVLPFFTARLGKDVFEHVFSGCVVNRLGLEVAGAFVNCTVGIMAQRDARASIVAMNNLLLLDEYPLAFHEVSLKLEPFGTPFTAATVSHLVRSLSVAFENGVSAEAGRGIGQRFPYRLPAQAFTASLSMDLYHADTLQLERFWGGPTGPAATGSTELHAEIRIDSGTFGSLVLYFPRVFISRVQQQPTGRGEMTQPIELTPLIAEVTLPSPTLVVNTVVMATVLNDQTTMGG